MHWYTHDQWFCTRRNPHPAPKSLYLILFTSLCLLFLFKQVEQAYTRQLSQQIFVSRFMSLIHSIMTVQFLILTASLKVLNLYIKFILLCKEELVIFIQSSGLMYWAKLYFFKINPHKSELCSIKRLLVIKSWKLVCTRVATPGWWSATPHPWQPTQFLVNRAKHFV